MKPSVRVPNRAQRELRSYEARWLPPLSAGTLLGLALFFTFVGSTVWSTLPPTKNLLQTYTGAAVAWSSEKATCRSRAACAAAAANATAGPRRTIYMQPVGGLGSRLRAVASAMTLAKQTGARAVIVWQDEEHGFSGAWPDLFESPDIPIGCFPGGTIRPEAAACKVHTISSAAEWTVLADGGAWERPQGGEEEALCVRSGMYLTPSQRDLGWFYEKLRPAAAVRARVDAFQATQRWNEPGTTCVGVHARRTDLRLRCTSQDCVEGVPVGTALPLSAFTSAAAQVAALAPMGSKVRFFLATDDPDAEIELKEMLGRHAAAIAEAQALEAVAANGTAMAALPLVTAMDATSTIRVALELPPQTAPSVVTLPKPTREAAGGWLAARSVVGGVQEAAADLYLLSQCHVIIGTVGSSFRQAARLWAGGQAFFITAGADLELKTLI